MNSKIINEQIARSAKTILSWCMARTDNQNEAEDLAQDIMLEIIKSTPNLRDEEAFYGFMWSVARNTLHRYYARKKRTYTDELTDALTAEDEITALLDSMEEAADIRLLRRELSLLSEQYRRATVYYYIENRTCREIADLMGISESMVKYLLFKSRKLLKEGITMERNYGVQSYLPKSLALGFWGRGTNNYNSILMNKKIPQNILFACYNDRLSAEEISLEIGVALPYMEDDLRILEENNLILRDGSRYLTNILIYTEELNREIAEKTNDIQQKIADTVREMSEKLMKEIRSDFDYTMLNENELRWHLVCKLFYEGVINKAQGQVRRDPPLDRYGVPCYIWGIENFDENVKKQKALNIATGHIFDCFGLISFMDCSGNGEAAQHYFWNNKAAVSILLRVASGESITSGSELAIAAELVKRGYLRSDEQGFHVDVPVYSEEAHNRLLAMIDRDTDTIARAALEVIEPAKKCLRSHVPTHLKKTADELAFLRLLDDSMNAPTALLVKDGYLAPLTGQKLPATTFIYL
ncbi:MAG: sigma-70 family RNA polymerase sigma factor [Clostridia bacterium]|nr:sigma-70 family RNA polymerase sigma factor [Clostridia bacterium]